MSNQQNIDAFFKQFEQKLQRVNQRLSKIIGTEIINSATDNFRTESFEGKKWKARKDKSNKRKLLIGKTGQLWRSPRIVMSSLNRVEVGSDLPYADIHNRGGNINRAARSELFVRNRHSRGKLGKMFGGMGAFRKGTTPGKGLEFKAYTITIPQRQFLGVGIKLKRKLEKTIKEEILNEFSKK